MGINRIMNLAAIRRLDNGQTGAGTVFTACGGYNCRHRWRPVNPAWFTPAAWREHTGLPYPESAKLRTTQGSRNDLQSQTPGVPVIAAGEEP